MEVVICELFARKEGFDLGWGCVEDSLWRAEEVLQIFAGRFHDWKVSGCGLD